MSSDATGMRYRKFEDAAPDRPGGGQDQSTRPNPDGWCDAQFGKPKIKVPYKAIAYAVLLFVVGTVLIVIGSLMQAGVYFTKDTERSVPMICVGSLAFIPGSYITFTAYKAWNKEPGWSFDDIPSTMDED